MCFYDMIYDVFYSVHHTQEYIHAASGPSRRKE